MCDPRTLTTSGNPETPECLCDDHFCPIWLHEADSRDLVWGKRPCFQRAGHLMSARFRRYTTTGGVGRRSIAWRFSGLVWIGYLLMLRARARHTPRLSCTLTLGLTRDVPLSSLHLDYAYVEHSERLSPWDDVIQS